MPIKRQDLDHVRQGHRISCRRAGGARAATRKCYACDSPSTVICDHPKELPEGVVAADLEENPDLALQLATCSRPCCARHGCWWTGKKHLCKEHGQQEGVWS
jgi:hypothetical protein